MEKINTSFAHKVLKILKWAFLVLVGAFLILVVVRIFHFFNLDKTNAQIAKIHATKLKLSDVIENNLPPDPGAEADKTIAGIDANNNGIRDDVEIAIFKAYPDSAKTRAVLLQYALALQMETLQSIVNKEIVTEVVTEQSRAYSCVGKILSRDDMDIYLKKSEELRSFIKTRQLNTEARKNARNSFVEQVGSYSESTNVVCDIDLSRLPN